LLQLGSRRQASSHKRAQRSFTKTGRIGYLGVEGRHFADAEGGLHAIVEGPMPSEPQAPALLAGNPPAAGTVGRGGSFSGGRGFARNPPGALEGRTGNVGVCGAAAHQEFPREKQQIGDRRTVRTLKKTRNAKRGPTWPPVLRATSATRVRELASGQMGIPR